MERHAVKEAVVIGAVVGSRAAKRESIYIIYTKTV